MSTFEIVAAVFAGLVILVTIWQLIKNGIAKSNGRIPEYDGNWWGGA